MAIIMRIKILLTTKSGDKDMIQNNLTTKFLN